MNNNVRNKHYHTYQAFIKIFLLLGVVKKCITENMIEIEWKLKTLYYLVIK